jgi:putative peptide zinc metalloprotease protein
LAYAIALGLVKVGHELGHAYAATRFGCRVPAMGVSFLVMMPVLYTDTTAAWQLTSRRQRLIIDCAGVTVELMIASAATLLWVLLPHGPARSAVHVIATTSWVTSLIINLSPFLRFDGYYMLSDALGMPNLQPRAFALGRWRLRELLFDLREPPPEKLPTQLRRTVILYAWATWIYRLVLFLGIALLVYHLFFKALGIILFVVEMAVFIGRPLFSEIGQWHRLRDRIAASRRGRIWPWVAGGLALLAVLPIDRHVSAPAVLTPIGDTPLVIASPAQIDRILVRNDQLVERGAPLFILSDPAIERDIASSEARIARIETQVARAGADVLDLANITVLQRELMSERNGRAGLERRREQLILRAQTSGRVIDIPADIHVGRWLAGGSMLGRIVTPGRYDILAYVAENDIGRVKNGADARFVPDDAALASRRARVVELGQGALEFLNSPMLASTNGGAIAVSEDESRRLKPQETIYQLRLVAERDARAESNPVVQQVPGRIVVRATGESHLGRFVRGVGRLVARESTLTG